MLTEQDGQVFRVAIKSAPTLIMSALNVYETRLVLTGGPRGVSRFAAEVLEEFQTWLALLPIEVVPFDLEQAVLAHRAYLLFGKGINPASLNLVDCAAYALAKLRGEPLLFKGDDFARTDIRSALEQP